MPRQFELKSAFRVFTLLGLLLAWLGLALGDCEAPLIFGVIAAPGVFLLGPIVIVRRQEPLMARILLGIAFILGWCGMAAYLAMVAIALPTSQAAATERFGIIERDFGQVCALLILVPFCFVCVLLYRAWMWAYYDSRLATRQSTPGCHGKLASRALQQRS